MTEAARRGGGHCAYLLLVLNGPRDGCSVFHSLTGNDEVYRKSGHMVFRTKKRRVWGGRRGENLDEMTGIEGDTEFLLK